MNRPGIPVVIFSLVLLLFSCDDDTVCGGPCRYTEIPGTASIISVVDVGGETFCDEPVELLYNFIPDDPDQINPSFLANWPLDSIQYIIAEKNPPRKWVEAFGLLPGTEHRCSRFRMYSGACTPIVYGFQGIDDASVYDSCTVWEPVDP
jgi:hypothetical protein